MALHAARRWRWLAAVCVGASPALAAGAPVTTADVNRAIARGVAYLKSVQQPDGSWPYAQRYLQGATALATLTLINAGVPRSDPAVKAGVFYINGKPLEFTYCVALTAMALATVDSNAHIGKITACRDWLLLAQQTNGGWTYTRGLKAKPDNSNTQFAVLGLRAAQQSGAPAPRRVWDKIDGYFRSSQRGDGGWGYRQVYNKSYGSMTAAGLASIVICGAQERRNIERCGQYAYDASMLRALKWFDRFFTVQTNPGRNRNHLYYLYAIERVGVLTARRRLGGKDWYREGAQLLVQMQKPDGSWGSGVAGIPDTCFALLFLAKGKAPVLVHKLKRRRDWNNDPNDIRNLCAYFSEVAGQRVSWQIVDFDMSLRDLLAAPVLYFNGHREFKFTKPQIALLQEYITQGGFIFAEACCSRKEFDRSFRAFMKQLYPDQELEELPKDHPVYTALLKLAPDERRPLFGLRASCRTSIIYSPTDMSCKWEKQQIADSAFKLGINVLAYATGMEPLRGKLDKVEIVEPTKTGPTLRGAFVLAQVKHGFDWEPDTRSAAGLLQYMRSSLNLDVGSDKVAVALTNPDLFDYPVLYMVGHHPVVLADEEKARLKLYLERGGFLFAESCCGNSKFDGSFRKLMEQLFPDRPLKRLPAEHPIFHTGFSIRSVKYRQAVIEKQQAPIGPWLEGIEFEGRLGVVYSKFGLGCGWENHPCQKCLGVVRDDALKLGANVVLYGLTN